MKRSLQKHIFILLVILNGIFAFANSNQKTSSDYSAITVDSFHKSNKNFPHLKIITSNEEEVIDTLKFTETDIEEEESFLSENNRNFNFFLAYFDTKICANHFHSIQNRLAPSMHINYLSALSSRTILFCVYRL